MAGGFALFAVMIVITLFALAVRANTARRRQHMTNWYTADTHFGHEKVIAFCGRPFRNAGHMDTVLIENLWSKVGPDDDLWIVSVVI